MKTVILFFVEQNRKPDLFVILITNNSYIKDKTGSKVAKVVFYAIQVSFTPLKSIEIKKEYHLLIVEQKRKIFEVTWN